jgi:hypothetical protein
MSNDQLMEALAIRTVVDNWVLWRDAGDWERFRTVWHDDGYMMATWFQGTADEFIRVSQGRLQPRRQHSALSRRLLGGYRRRAGHFANRLPHGRGSVTRGIY